MLTSVKRSSCTVTADLRLGTVLVQCLAPLFSQECNTPQGFIEMHLLMYQEHRLLQEHSRKVEASLFSKHYTVYTQLGNYFKAQCHGISKADKAKKNFLRVPEKNLNRQVLLPFKKVQLPDSDISVRDLSCKIYVLEHFKG